MEDESDTLAEYVLLSQDLVHLDDEMLYQLSVKLYPEGHRQSFANS
jgi:hypothetical protein